MKWAGYDFQEAAKFRHILARCARVLQRSDNRRQHLVAVMSESAETPNLLYRIMAIAMSLLRNRLSTVELN